MDSTRGVAPASGTGRRHDIDELAAEVALDGAALGGAAATGAASAKEGLSFQDLLALILAKYNSVAAENRRLRLENTSLQDRPASGTSPEQVVASRASQTSDGSLLLPLPLSLDAVNDGGSCSGAPMKLLQQPQEPAVVPTGTDRGRRPGLDGPTAPTSPNFARDLLPAWQNEWEGGILRQLSPGEWSSIRGLNWDRNQKLLGDRYSQGGACSILSRFVWHPESFKRMFWDFTGSCFLLFDIIRTPLLVFQYSDTFVERVMGLCTTTYWTVDIGVSFLRGYHAGCVVEMRPKVIATRYALGPFAPDLCIALVDWCLFLISSQVWNIENLARMVKAARLVRIIRLLRLVRLLKMPGFFRQFKKALGLTSEFSVSISNIVVSLTVIVVVSHFVACGWYALGTLAEPSWIDVLDDEQRDLPYRYITALHWTITQFTPASMEVQPRNVSERVFAICTILVGLVMFSSFVSSITSTMSALRADRSNRSKQEENFRCYIKENHLSLELGSRISSFLHTYKFSARRRITRKDIPLFKALPKNLRLLIDHQVYSPILMSHPLFHHLGEISTTAMVQICSSALQEVSLGTCEDLFHCGEAAEAMYFTKSGSMQYYHGFDERQPVDVDGGDYTWLAEPALWLVWLHQGRVFALTNCELLKFRAEPLHKALLSYPLLHRACNEYARLFYSRIGALMSSKVQRAEAPEPQQEPRREEPALSDLEGLDQDVLLELAQTAFSCAEHGAEFNDTEAAAIVTPTMQSVRRMQHATHL